MSGASDGSGTIHLMVCTSADRRAAPRPIGATRTAIALQLVALALTVGTVARALVGRDGALVIASCLLTVILLSWAAFALVDSRRRRRNPIGADGS